VFDTAVAMLALATPSAADAKANLARGRRFLIRSQTTDGGWPETTRPPGGQSYAQHTSTTAWSLQALLATPKLKDGAPY
jgi:hypothetical protein